MKTPHPPPARSRHSRLILILLAAALALLATGHNRAGAENSVVLSAPRIESPIHHSQSPSGADAVFTLSPLVAGTSTNSRRVMLRVGIPAQTSQSPAGAQVVIWACR